MHPYFIFKDLVTIFAFFLVLSVMVFFYPNVLGQMWPFITILIVNVIKKCAICWKDILFFLLFFLKKNFLYITKNNKFNFCIIKKIVKIYNRTIYVRGLLNIEILSKFVYTKLYFNINPEIVKYYYKISNQPITKIINNKYLILLKLLVGISETLRAKSNDITINNTKINSIFFNAFNYLKLEISKTKKNFLIQSKDGIKNNDIVKDNHNNEISLEFKQWFAGLTDGDGYIYVTKQGHVGFEITVHSTDEKVVRIIQNTFGGNVHHRAGLKAIRYRTQNKNSVSKIINCLNGLVINNIRLAQLHKACLTLNIPIKDPITPDINSAYLSGLLDSDGHINIYKYFYNDTYRYQLTIAITNKNLCNIDFLTKVIGGKCYYDKRLNGIYKWVANSKLLHLKLYDYFLKFPPKTIKGHRTFLIKEFHMLNEQKFYLETNKLSAAYKIWQKFYTRWNSLF